MSIIVIVESATERIAGKARRNEKRTAGRPEGHDVKAHFENCIVFGKMQGIKRHEKHMKSVKLQTENKHRTFTLALQDARIPRAQRPKREGKEKNHENQEKR